MIIIARFGKVNGRVIDEAEFGFDCQTNSSIEIFTNGIMVDCVNNRYTFTHRSVLGEAKVHN
jgi:hypothetical protein